MMGSYRPLFHGNGVYGPSAHVEHDSRQRPAWWARGWGTGSQIEPSLVARTVKTVFGWPRNDRTRQVRALLAERHELARCHAYQHARLVFVRIGEYDCSADGQIVD